MINKMKIIALQGKEKTRETISNILKDNGFCVRFLYDEVEKCLKSINESLEDEKVIFARKQGYNISKKYWINLLLMSNKTEKTVIVPDILPFEIQSDMKIVNVDDLKNKEEKDVIDYFYSFSV
jgi:hypothetical protein